MASEVDEKGTKLNGRKRQRIACARALATKHKLLIRDEVISVLDPRIERDKCRQIPTFAEGMAVLASTTGRLFSISPTG
jgi:ABC-type polar amino acid transport system ATPase subunit